MRAAYAKTIGRPTLAEIIPGITITDPDSPATTRTITAINAGLNPWTANSYDLTFELYELKGATASVSLFRKDISNFFGSVRTPATPALLAELARVLERPKFDVILQRSNTSRLQTLAQVRQLAEVIAPPPLAQPVCRDPDDDAVLALALSAQADFVISGDDDLLSLHPFDGIQILTPAQGLQRVLAAL